MYLPNRKHVLKLQHEKRNGNQSIAQVLLDLSSIKWYRNLNTFFVMKMH